ncbi:MAG: methyltransferase domain-containing protein [Pseudomonadota bacterium]
MTQRERRLPQGITNFIYKNRGMKARQTRPALADALTPSLNSLIEQMHARLEHTEKQLDDVLTLLRYTEERTRTNEALIRESLILVHATERRSQTLQFQGARMLDESSYQIDMLRKWYIESMPATLKLEQQSAFAKVHDIKIATDHPIALTSNDHLEPDSTTEGLVRPTQFVRHCIDVLGPDIRCLELGAGAAGLLFEYIQNGLVAIGIDGSDYCKKNRIGYWPLIPGNLFTCDLTHPFRFHREADSETMKFNLITAWEVFEHIAEADLSQTLANVATHLEPEGYFIGSISMIEYLDKNGRPYHVTLKPRTWWKEKFEKEGLYIVDDHPFNARLFCRGNGPRFQDFHNYFNQPEDGFHFAARKVSPDY